MKNRYFGSLCLRAVVIAVKTKYPDCTVRYVEEEMDKQVIFYFPLDKIRTYHLSDGIKKYNFINGHLILGNLPVDPIKFDAFDRFVEQTELEYEIATKRNLNEKTLAAIEKCQDFHDNAVVTIGNVKDGDNFDLLLILNDVKRYYRLSSDANDVHLQRIENEIDMGNHKEFKLSELPKKVKYKILKTTHPGLLTEATEYICGLREDKIGWLSVKDAYLTEAKRDFYHKLNITNFDVLADFNDSRTVGEFVNMPMRHLVLMNGKEFAYNEKESKLVPYSNYLNKRNEILNEYKSKILEVCKAVNMIPMSVIDEANDNKEPEKLVITKPAKTIILEIRKHKMEDPFYKILEKLERTVKVSYNTKSFLLSSRQDKLNPNIKIIDINEKGKLLRIDLNMDNLELSKPYALVNRFDRIDVNINDRLPFTSTFIELFKKELNTIKESPEYLLTLAENEWQKLGYSKVKDSENENSTVTRTYSSKNGNIDFYCNPYDKSLSIRCLSTLKDSDDIKKIKEIYYNYFDRSKGICIS